MPVVIQKFGGKLLENPAKIRLAAEFVLATKAKGEDPVVVVSAPGTMTDRIIEAAHEISNDPDNREMDMMLSVGERMAMSLLAIAINDSNQYRAVSFTGSQVGIITDTRHTEAKLIEVKGFRIKEALERGEIPIVAGFQGVSTEREITTLGRGGSDATAISLAVVLDAVRCELIKECGGVYTADPELVDNAAPISEIDYDTLSAITASGAQVVQSRAVSLAKEHKVSVKIIGLGGNAGTMVRDRSLEQGLIASVVLDENLMSLPVSNGKAETELEGNCSTTLLIDGDGLLVAKRSSDMITGAPVSNISIVSYGDSLDWSVVEQILDHLNQNGIQPGAVTGIANRICLIVKPNQGAAAVSLIHNLLSESGLIENIIDA